MTTTETNPIDEARLEAFVGQAVTDMGAAISGLLLHIGDRLGLYKAMAGAGPITSATLAARTGTAERYVREWLGNQAAGGYVTYDPADGTYELPAEQAMVVANENSPVFLGGAFEVIASCYADHTRFTDAFRTGAGVGWHEHDDRLFSGVLRLFRPGYAAHLVSAWLPALDGVVDKLQSGASVADVGCGLGASTIIMAQAFGRSTFFGVDNHEASITAARKAAAEAGVAQRTRFETTSAREFPGAGYDLVCMFDCLHDMGDPLGAARHRAPGPGAGRHAAAGGADGRRRARGEPEPGRADLLRPVHGDLHAGIARPGGRPGARRAGRRAAAGGAADRGGLQQRAPCDPDPVQPHPGGQAMTVAPIAASSACPRARSAPPMATSVRAH